MKIKHPEIKSQKRKITNRGCRKVIYFYPSLINKTLVPCESGLEWDMLNLLELDRASIQSYDSQPHMLTYYDGTKKRSYTPDFLIKNSATEIILEVKPIKKLPLHIKKLQAVEIAYAKLGKRFILLTDEYIRKQPRLDNAKLILRHARHKVSRISMKALVDHFKRSQGPQTIRTVKEQLAQCNVQEADIFKLIYVGIIRFDPEESLNRDSVIWFSNNVDA